MSYKEQEHIKETEQDTACSMHYHDTNLDIEESFRDVAAKEEEKQHIVSNRLKELVEYAGVFTQKKSGKDILSIETGRKLQILCSICTCSVHKLPLIFGTVYSIVFGLIDGTIFDALVRSPACYDYAISRSEAIFSKLGIKSFLENNNNPERVLSGNLIMDASTKEGHHVVVKLVSTLDLDSSVRLRALHTDITNSS